MSVAAIGDQFAFMDFRLHDAVWGMVPEGRLAFFRAAEATIIAANGVFAEPPEGASDAARIYWERGYADRLIASVEAACAYWKMSEGAYVEAVERISAWFAGLGWTRLAGRLADTLAYADRAHNAAEGHRKVVVAALKGAGGTARNGASQNETTRRTTR